MGAPKKQASVRDIPLIENDRRSTHKIRKTTLLKMLGNIFRRNKKSGKPLKLRFPDSLDTTEDGT